MINGGAIIPQLCAFVRQPIKGKGVTRFCGNELLEHFTARLLRLGHRMKHRIIFVLPQSRKVPNSNSC
jgi:hypothetical protein